MTGCSRPRMCCPLAGWDHVVLGLGGVHVVGGEVELGGLSTHPNPGAADEDHLVGGDVLGMRGVPDDGGAVAVPQHRVVRRRSLMRGA
jgi:hypothetical protein